MKSNFGLKLEPKKTTERDLESEFEQMLIKSGAKGSYMCFQGFLQDEIPKHLRVIDQNAKEELLPKWLKNFNDNIPRIYAGLDDLKQHLVEAESCIVVGAGPSLDKNIFELTKAKIPIFATDRSYPKLLSNGIIPDYIVTVDADEKIQQYYPHLSNILQPKAILSCTCSPNLKPDLPIVRWYIPSIDAQTDKTLELMTGLPIIESGGNVGTTSCRIAEYLGYSEIILVGMDFAYNDGTPYEQMDWYNKLKEAGGEEMAKKAHKIIEHKAWGTKCVSDPLFDSYRLAFYQFLSKTKCKVISAVEGGSIEHNKLECKKLEECLAETNT